MARPSAAFAALPALLVAFALAGCSSGGGASFDGEVIVADDEFRPDAATVDAGTDIRFVVAEDAVRAHTVTIHKAGEPESTLRLDGALQAGDATHYTFGEAGTYHVWCKFHGTMTSGMAMLVTVK